MFFRFRDAHTRKTDYYAAVCAGAGKKLIPQETEKEIKNGKKKTTCLQ